jgi:hypothetical protein
MLKIHVGLVLRHRSGRVYTVIAIANTSHDMPKHPADVVLLGANGNLWTRELADFGSEKFSVLFDGTALAPVNN